MLQITDFITHGAAKFRVEIGQRLVEQQHLRLQHQRTRNGNTLLLATRKLAWITGAKMFKPDKRQPSCAFAAASPALEYPGENQPVGHVLENGLVREQGIGLEYHGHIAFCCRKMRYVDTTNRICP